MSISGVLQFKISDFILNLFAIRTSYIRIAWYVRYYIILVVSFPIYMFALKALPHNSSAALAMPFLPSASCRNLDLPPVNLRFLQSHLTKNAFAIAPTHLCGIA